MFVRSLFVAVVCALAVAATPAVAATTRRAQPAAAPNVGIYPTVLTFDNALRGGRYEQTLGVITSGSTPLVFTVTAMGGVGAWLGFFDPNAPTVARQFVTADPRGQLVVRLNVPRRTANGTYKGKVRVISQAVAPTSGNRSGVQVGADIVVTVHVTGTQIVKGQLDDSRALSKIEPSYPLRITNIVENNGNVVMTPNLDITIEHDGQNVASLNFHDRTVAAGGRSSIETDWRTRSSTDLGKYIAHVAASFDGVVLGARDVPFEIVPYGSLRRAGRFESLVLANKVASHGAADVRAVFRNTGQIEVKAVFVGVLERNGRAVRSVTSTPILTLPGQQQTIDAFVNVDAGGHYDVKGRINFDGRQTAERTVAFRVGAASRHLLLALLVAALLVLVAYVVWRARRRKSTRKQKSKRAGVDKPIDLSSRATRGRRDATTSRGSRVKERL